MRFTASCRAGRSTCASRGRMDFMIHFRMCRSRKLSNTASSRRRSNSPPATRCAASGRKATCCQGSASALRSARKLSQIAKGFRYEGGESSRKVTPIKSLKPTVVGALVRKAAAEDRQVLVWCVFDEEAKIVGRHLKGVKGVAQLHGDTPEGKRERILEDFRHGKIRVLVGKAGMLGYGLNFPFVETMVFSGYDDSFERFYQAVRRAYRYGAKKRLTVHLPYIPGLEDHIWENILRKKSQWEEDTAACERAYAAAFSCIQNKTTKS
ncbi:hypothetical protein Ga0100230_004230 [Opitutaceae bacterium TAV3]|nr:hypothetical protein Ga0100230_004230 [Opitutaceae bacterium TAV3]